jgi:hypothetical protein
MIGVTFGRLMAWGWGWLVAVVLNYCLHSVPTVGPESGVGLPLPARTHTVNQAGLTVDARFEVSLFGVGLLVVGCWCVALQLW